MARQDTPKTAELEQQDKPNQKKHGVIGRLVFVLIVLIVALIVLQGSYFRLKNVYVFGNQQRTAQDVVVASGLVQGLNMLAINEEEIAQNIASDHWLVFLRMEKVFPNTINLYVSERKPVTVMQWLGVQYTLDDQGMVMTERNDRNLPEGMTYITGLMVVNIHVGLHVEMKDQRQLEAYRAFMYELQRQYYLDQISEINLKDVDSIYMVTTDGIIIRMGDYSNAKAKVCALRTDVAYLRQLGKTSGLLDVSVPEDAKYTPDS